MNCTKALMGLILFANVNTFTMDNDNDTQVVANIKLNCGICGKEMEKVYAQIKKAFHRDCLLAYATDKYVQDNPIITSEPWKIEQTSTPKTTPVANKNNWGKHWQHYNKRTRTKKR